MDSVLGPGDRPDCPGGTPADRPHLLRERERVGCTAQGGWLRKCDDTL
jgi:hypothetical protein